MLTVYTVNGIKIKEYQLENGRHNLEVELENMPAGVYMYDLTIEGKRAAVKRMVIVK